MCTFMKILTLFMLKCQWVITDARHDSAYHTTVPWVHCRYKHITLVIRMLFFSSTHKIVGCVTLSRKDHTCAQTRGLACTKLVLPQVLSKGNQLKLKIHLIIISSFRSQ